jgi:hypothetical protein
MSWLISNALMKAYENSRFLPERGEASSAASSSAGEPSAPLNVMPTPHKFSRNGKTMESSNLSRFGLTCVTLTESRGEALLTWYRAGFHAQTSPSPDAGPESKVNNQDSGAKWPGSFARYDPDSRSWKTHQLSLRGGLEPFSETWPRWGTMRSGMCFQLRRWAHPTSENESGLWPTPIANDARKGGAFDQNNPRNGLPAAVQRFPTPTSKDRGTDAPNRLGSPSLGVVARAMVLGAAATQRMGNAPLNPDWVEWLMGWPIGQTDLSPLATARFQSWLRSHGKL